MFELRVETTFAATHAITMSGEREAVHGHDWRVVATVAGPALDADGLLLDFHALEKTLFDTVRPFHNGDLNSVPPFDRLNPTAEHVALHVGRSLQERFIDPAIARGVLGLRLVSVAVTEAPGCVAVYRPG